ncbi:hypothetical protein [Terrisporobacter petrolearius]|uniref:hypothetical protein n=1 Tax=Terrisporobacter petrolearius TaxID=1460447 RepID=UPI0031CC46EE
MGMYTEFVFGVSLKKETPKDVINVLKYMTEEGSTEDIKIESLPKHSFFETERWAVLFISDSYYFDGITNTILKLDPVIKRYCLTVRSNLKNYDNEIDKFIDWIKPYVEGSWYEFLGYKRNEENEGPTLIYLNCTTLEVVLIQGQSIDDLNNKKIDEEKKNIFKRIF